MADPAVADVVEARPRRPAPGEARSTRGRAPSRPAARIAGAPLAGLVRGQLGDQLALLLRRESPRYARRREARRLRRGRGSASRPCPPPSRAASRRPRSRRCGRASPSPSPCARRAGREHRAAWRPPPRPLSSHGAALARFSPWASARSSRRRTSCALRGRRRSASRRSRRSVNGRSSRAFRLPSASRSKARISAGVRSASIRTRDSAGWSRFWSASKFSWPSAPRIRSSPSST